MRKKICLETNTYFKKGNTEDYSPKNFIANSLSVQVKSQNWPRSWIFQEYQRNTMSNFLGLNEKYITKIFRVNKEKITKNLASFPIGVI